MMVHKQQDGFTLIEVLISISLLTIALLGLCGATVMAMKGNSLSQMSTKATIMAKDKIEGLKNLNYTQITGGADTPEANYTRQWTVTTVTPDVPSQAIHTKPLPSLFPGHGRVWPAMSH